MYELVNDMVFEAKELLKFRGLEAEKDVLTILKAAQIIVITNELFETTFFEKRDKIIKDITRLHKKRLQNVFSDYEEFDED